jgi:CheY-like chemotaxis protein
LPGTAKKSVLVVDDERGFRDLFVFFLEPMGLEVVCAENGRIGLEKICQRSFEIVFMDVHMPEMDGFQALREIWKIRPEQKVIILSSCSDPQYIQENKALADGAVECLMKPLELHEIEKVLRKVL